MDRIARGVLALAFSLTCTSLVVVPPKPAFAVCGDVNGDEVVNIGDALAIAQCDVGLRSCTFPLATSCDTTITTTTTMTSTTTTLRFVDNGDGTVTDNQTGLQWEKKVAGSGCPHCVNDVYQWSSNSLTAPDGPAFTSFLATLNNCVDDGSGTPPTGVTGGFASHCDWRLPTIAELQTILLRPFFCAPGPCHDQPCPCIDPIFGPTAENVYWSSTSNAAGPIGVWTVNFYSGGVNSYGKSDYLFVRAVRGGS